MHSAPRILLLSLALIGWATADLPKKAPISRYTGLWTNSPFTSKPPPPDAGPTVNPLEDYALVGVSPIGASPTGDSNYRVTLLNKKKPEERVVVDSDNPKSTFKILKINRKPGDPLGTVVHMSSGAVEGDVSFDEKLLVLAIAPAAKVNPKAQPGVPPVPVPQPQIPGQPQRQPRPRVVPPPTPTTAQPRVQQPQPNLPNQTNRPSRRGGR